MVGIGWVINAYADSLAMLYFGAVVSGMGGGAVYATCVGMAVKWFPDRARTRGRPDRGRLWRRRGASP